MQAKTLLHFALWASRHSIRHQAALRVREKFYLSISACAKQCNPLLHILQTAISFHLCKWSKCNATNRHLALTHTYTYKYIVHTEPNQLCATLEHIVSSQEKCVRVKLHNHNTFDILCYSIYVCFMVTVFNGIVWYCLRRLSAFQFLFSSLQFYILLYYFFVIFYIRNQLQDLLAYLTRSDLTQSCPMISAFY